MEKTILIVDDEEPIVDILRFNLKKKDIMFLKPMTAKRHLISLWKKIPI